LIDELDGQPRLSADDAIRGRREADVRAASAQ
jgi:hypothetical protein